MGFIKSSQRAEVSRDATRQQQVQIGIKDWCREARYFIGLVPSGEFGTSRQTSEAGLHQVLGFFGVRRGLCLAGFIDAQTIRDSEFSKHSVDVILDSLFGHLQVIGDFFVA
jgi:hypothetical protein